MARTPLLRDYTGTHELMAALVNGRVGAALGNLPRVVTLAIVCIGRGVRVDCALARNGVAIAVLGVDREGGGLLRAHLPSISFSDRWDNHVPRRYL